MRKMMQLLSVTLMAGFITDMSYVRAQSLLPVSSADDGKAFRTFIVGRDYDHPADNWLIEVSGIPFGLTGQMLQDGGNRWRRMVFGITQPLRLFTDTSWSDMEVLG